MAADLGHDQSQEKAADISFNRCSKNVLAHGNKHNMGMFIMLAASCIARHCFDAQCIAQRYDERAHERLHLDMFKPFLPEKWEAAA